MKKFVKYGLIGGCVLALAGVGLVTASVALGADMQRIFCGTVFGSSVIRYPEDSYFKVDKDGIQIKAGNGEIEVGQNGVQVKDGDRQVLVDGDGIFMKTENSWISPSEDRLQSCNQSGG